MKSSTMSMCSDVAIASRTEGGSVSCLHADVDSMYATNRFEPTEVVEEATRSHLEKYFHPSDIEEFLSNPSGTMVQMKSFLPETASYVDAAMDELRQALSSAFPHHPTIQIFLQKDDEKKEEIKKNDVFYTNSPESIKYEYHTELKVYSPERTAAPLRVIEHVQQMRQWNTGKGKGGRGIVLANHYYEHDERAKHATFYTGCETEVSQETIDKLKPKLIGTIKVRPIQVTDAAFNAEGGCAEEARVDNKGFHVRRGLRNVGSGLRFGYKFNDRSSHAADRQRVEVTFEPALDNAMGSTWYKNGAGPHKVIGDTLYRIYKQVTYEWTRKTDEEIARQKAEAEASRTDSSHEVSEEEDESYASIPMPPTPLSATNIGRRVASPVVPRPASAATTPQPSPVVQHVPVVSPTLLPPLPVESSLAPSQPDSPTRPEPVVDPDIQWVRDNEERLKKPAVLAELRKLLAL